MNKITLTIALVLGFTIANAQDTTCTLFAGKGVIEFNYYTSRLLSVEEQDSEFYDIEVKLGDVLCLHLCDEEQRVRKVIITFSDGSTSEEVLDSYDDIYYLSNKIVNVSVGKPKLMIKL
mgnify:FL=1|tara:strand:+ start:551 stop:907 length:357 start_codon:yes stop_codon:yes gene_type:complete